MGEFIFRLIFVAAYFVPFVAAYHDHIVDALKHESTPGWTQGIGSIAAVFGAAMIAIWQEHKKEKIRLAELHQEAYGLSLLVSPEFKRLIGDIEVARGETDFRKMIVRIPDVIAKRVDRFWIMGAGGANLLQAVGALEVNISVLQRWEPLIATGKLTPADKFVCGSARQLLQVVLDEIDEAEKFFKEHFWGN